MTCGIRNLGLAALLGFGLVGCAAQPAPKASATAQAAESGVVTVRSGYAMAETIARIKQDIADKGLMFFQEVDQARLAADAGIELRPSTLLVFGNPALGAQFMTSNPQSGIDWPVRLLVFEDANGEVWAVYNAFDRIASRHGIVDRAAQFDMAAAVIASITASVAAR